MGQMMGNGTHIVDTLRWMCGGEVVEVQSVTRRVGTPDINFMTAIVLFDNDATGIMIGNFTTGRRRFDVEMHGLGISAVAEVESKGYLRPHDDPQGTEFDTREVAGSDETYVFGGFQAKNREFIDCVRSGQQPGSHFGDALKTMELAEMVLAQALLIGE